MTVRKSMFSGSWYPGDEKSLRNALEGYLSSAASTVSAASTAATVDLTPPRAIIAPHAGYVYSASVAASAFKSIRGCSYRTVIVMAPSHRVAFNGVAAWGEGAFATPLGKIPVDEDFVSALVENSALISDFREPHESEHSLEMELPFLQYLLPPFKLVPLIIGGQSPETAGILATELDLIVDGRDDVLVVASTDLSHFHPAKKAEELDGRAIEFIRNMDGDGLLKAEEDGLCELCGLMPVSTLLSMSSFQGAQCTITDYTHSGRVTGDNSSVVGYLSAVIR